mmetsp:Transcript_14286/g.38850  ORF Transcript_14286/g.38850 Transcript_14286/m.38850 type:complete len:271 (-) Transcript_14286:2173-2985(-)
MRAPPRVQFQAAPYEGSWRHHTSRTCEPKVVVGDPPEIRNSHFRHLGLAGHRAKSHTLATRPRSLHRGLSLEQAPREFWTQGLPKFWIQALREFWIHVQCAVLEASLQLFQHLPLCLPSPRRSELFHQPEQSRRCMAFHLGRLLDRLVILRRHPPYVLPVRTHCVASLSAKGGQSLHKDPHPGLCYPPSAVAPSAARAIRRLGTAWCRGADDLSRDPTWTWRTANSTATAVLRSSSTLLERSTRHAPGQSTLPVSHVPVESCASCTRKRG